MLRTVLITLINLALPYLIYVLWQAVLKLHKSARAKRNQPPVIDVTPVRRWPWLRLLACGLLLLGFSLVVLRLHEGPEVASGWHQANPAKNVEF